MAALGGTLTPGTSPTTVSYGAYTPGFGLLFGGVLSSLNIDPSGGSGFVVPEVGIIWPNGVNV